MAERDPVDAAREAALRLLERARRTRRELEKKLAEAGHGADPARRALDRLTEVGLIDDLEAAKAFARAQWARRATSRLVVRRRLLARGVAAAVVDEALAALALEAEAADGADGGAGGDPLRAPTADGERARAERAAAALCRRYARLDPKLARSRLAAALVRRGFGRDAVTHALRTALDTPGGRP